MESLIQVIIRKGEADTCFYILLSGKARVIPDQKADVLTHLEPGDVFGEIGFILHSPRNSWVLANNRCA
ncbi:MAG: cyclic nucleotide-binding domain-containing protein [Reinekea sp.]